MDQLQEIFHCRPALIIRWGTWIFLLILVAFLGLTFFIRYPEVARATLLIRRSPSGGYYGRLETPETTAKRVGAGLQVWVEVQGYPANSYGYLEGRTLRRTDSTAGTDSPVLVAVSRGLITTRGRHIPYTDGLLAHAAIHLGEQRLCNRLLQELSFHPRLP